MPVRLRLTVVALIIISLACGVRTIFSQELGSSTKLPFFGTWVRNEAESSWNRGDRPRTSSTPRGNSKWEFELDNGGVRQSHYDMADSTSPRITPYYKFDGKEWPDPHGPGVSNGNNGPGELLLTYLVNPYTQIRHTWVKAKTTEWSFYVISADGKTFTVTAWDETKPWARNIQVFDRVQ
jgi:hypothetical protein